MNPDSPHPIYIYIIKEAALKGTISLGGQVKRKDRKSLSMFAFVYTLKPSGYIRTYIYVYMYILLLLLLRSNSSREP